MITEYKYIVFEEKNAPHKKTKTYTLYNKKNNSSLGYVCWFSSWRQYCFVPAINTIFSSDCLADIQDFIKQLMDERSQANANTSL